MLCILCIWLCYVVWCVVLCDVELCCVVLCVLCCVAVSLRLPSPNLSSLSDCLHFHLNPEQFFCLLCYNKLLCCVYVVVFFRSGGRVSSAVTSL